MTPERTDTVIVGGGQAGIATSEHLGAAGIDHIVLERARIAESWRSARWDSLVANGPAWHDRFPNREFAGFDPDSFVGKDAVADYLAAYAAQVAAPIREGVEVTRAEPLSGRMGFRIETSQGPLEARNLVVATGAFQVPVIPAIAPDDPGLVQIHSSAYRNPDQLPDGAVLVVGAGSSGVQIADELNAAGRRVFLSVGAHERPPRRYRGRDFVWWLGVLGMWDEEEQTAGRAHVTIAVSGAHGGETVDFRALAGQGVILVGGTEAFERGTVRFRDDLGANIAAGDASLIAMMDAADAYVERMGLDLPEEPDVRQMLPDPPCMRDPIRALDLKAEGITSILWATGFRNDYSWLRADVIDADGRPVHQRGVTREPGLYFVGLPWLTRRGSAFIWGVWHDARHIVDHIQTQRKYLAYRGMATGKEG